MIAIAVDDEAFVLKALKKAVAASPDITSVTDFDNCTAALEWVQNNAVDIAFLDINMRGMGGLELAERILEYKPECKVIFCTGYSEYAVEAFRIHVSGYLMKPVSAEAVQKEIDHIKGLRDKKKLLTVRCFGNFEVYSNGVPVPFRRSKTKELFAFLVDRLGSGITAKQICARLWEDDSDDSRNMDYLRQLFADLRHTLSDVGAEAVLMRNGYQYSLDMQRLDCDYVQFRNNGTPSFNGEYMSQYSWAEETCALLLQKQNKHIY